MVTMVFQRVQRCCLVAEHTASTWPTRAPPLSSVVLLRLCAPSPPPPFPHTLLPSFDIGDAHFVVLEGGQDADFQSMAKWLTADLAAVKSAGTGTGVPPARSEGVPQPPRPRTAPYGWLITLVHEAPYSKGSEDSDTHRDQVGG